MGTYAHVGMCYGSMALFLSILHNVFLLYHVDVFVSIYKIDKTSFWIGETIFLLWNSLNDPLFGWLSDSYLLKSKGSVGRFVSSPALILRRLRILSFNGPLLGLSFLGFWFLWTYPSLQFVVCLCLYDAFLTTVDLHHTALLADLALATGDRTHLNFYSSLFSAIGSTSVFLSYMVWDRQSMAHFQLFCVILTIFSVCGFYAISRVLTKHFTRVQRREGNYPATGSKQPDNPLAQLYDEDVTLKRYIKQLNRHTNFKWFAVMNLVQVFNCHFNSNFFPLFLERLMGGSLSPALGSFLIGASFVIPHINNLYFLSLCRQYGLYTVIKWLFYSKCGLSALMFSVGPDYLWLLCIFIASNRVFTEGTCKLLNLVISDLVDEDCVIHRRSQAISALVFGTAALLSKPGQTLAPLIGTSLLALQTGRDIFQSNSNGHVLTDDGTSGEETELIRIGCFNCLVYIPLICSIIQIFCWSRFKLCGPRLEWIKSVRAGAGAMLSQV